MELAALKAKTDLRTVLEHYGLDLYGSGTVLSTLCPFHEETTPSLKVWETTQKWKCFGCGLHGDAIDFIKKTENISTSAAIRKLEQQTLGFPIIRKKRIKPPILPIDDKIIQGYRKELQANQEAIKWLIKYRHWRREVIEEQQIGLHNGRIQIPIGHPITRKWVDIRQYRPGAKPKMLPYSVERGAWPYIIGRGDSLVIVEGEPDALAVASLGFPVATNTCGANATAGVWRQWCGLLLSPVVILAFDNDEPGENAREVMKRLTGGVALTFPELGRKADITDAITKYGQEEVRSRLRTIIRGATRDVGGCERGICA